MFKADGISLQDLLKDEDGCLEDYLEKMSRRGTWGDGVILSAASMLYKSPIIVYSADEEKTIHISKMDISISTSKTIIRLGFINGNHYLSLLPDVTHTKATVLAADDVHETVSTISNQANTVISCAQKSVDCSDCVPNVAPAKELCQTSQTVQALPLASIQNYSSPNQPKTNASMYAEKLPTRTLAFQLNWFKEFPWLHYSVELNAVLCFHCATAHYLELPSLSAKSDAAFQWKGFRKWRKAKEKFMIHEKSSAHAHAVNQLHQKQRGGLTLGVIHQIKKKSKLLDLH